MTEQQESTARQVRETAALLLTEQPWAAKVEQCAEALQTELQSVRADTPRRVEEITGQGAVAEQHYEALLAVLAGGGLTTAGSGPAR